MKQEKWHGANGAGKGSFQRKTDHDKYSDNYDRIFGKKNKPDPSLYKQTSWCEEETIDKNISTVID